jgi:HK97 family phage major capsid protein
MAYNSIVNRSDAQALMPEDVAREIIQGVPQQSAVMQLARRLPDMSRKQRRLPVLSSLITAYFVSGDTGQKQTSEMAWGNKFINAEELAVIVPIPEAVLDDSDYDLWGEIRPRIAEAFGVAFDQAVMFGTNAPQDWPSDLLTGATTAGHIVDLSTQQAAGDDLYDIIMDTGGLIALVEEDGYNVNGHVAALSMRARLRGIREKVYDGNSTVAGGAPLFVRTMQTGSGYELDGSPVIFPQNGSIIPATALQFAGDWSQLVYSMRQDITYKVLTEAVIQDGAGNIVYNLAQQDMVALRAVMRLGWQLPNPINRINQNEATRYPFSVLVP